MSRLVQLDTLLSSCMDGSNPTLKNKQPQVSKHWRGKWEETDSLLSRAHTYACLLANLQAEIISDTSTESSGSPFTALLTRLHEAHGTLSFA